MSDRKSYWPAVPLSRDWLFVGTDNVDPHHHVLRSFLFGPPDGVKMPTEKEVRAAAERVLRRVPDGTGIGRRLVALLFDAPKFPNGALKTQHVISGFKKTRTKLPNVQRDFMIACEVESFMDFFGYDSAVAEVAKKRKLSGRQIARIYARRKRKTDVS